MLAALGAASAAARADCVAGARRLSLPAAHARKLLIEYVASHRLTRMTVGGDTVGDSRCEVNVGALKADGTFRLEVSERLWRLNVQRQEVSLGDVVGTVSCGYRGEATEVTAADLVSLGEDTATTFFVSFSDPRGALQVPISPKRAYYLPSVLRCAGE